MNVKEAVKTAIEYVKDLFSEEHLSNLGLEEVEYNEAAQVWQVTVGFSRPWDYKKPTLRNLFPDDSPSPQRDYKVVAVHDPSGRVLSVKDRELTKSQR